VQLQARQSPPYFDLTRVVVEGHLVVLAPDVFLTSDAGLLALTVPVRGGRGKESTELTALEPRALDSTGTASRRLVQEERSMPITAAETEAVRDEARLASRVIARLRRSRQRATPNNGSCARGVGEVLDDRAALAGCGPLW
jgi:hypothetical protein